MIASYTEMASGLKIWILSQVMWEKPQPMREDITYVMWGCDVTKCVWTIFTRNTNKPQK